MAKTTYNSRLMAERRETIIAETRKMLVEGGLEGLNMRELAERSGVAISTVYNLFSSKDQLVAVAVTGIFSSALDGIALPGTQPTLMVIENLTRRLVQRTRRGDAYSRAMTAIYFSSDSDSSVRTALQTSLQNWLVALMDIMVARGELQDWAPRAYIAHEISIHLWALVHDWVIGVIKGAKLARHFEVSVCIILKAFATPPMAAALEQKLKDGLGVNPSRRRRPASA